jgi:hypothetical protein
MKSKISSNSQALKRRGKGGQNRGQRRKAEELGDEDKAKSYFSCDYTICRTQVTKGNKIVATKT